FFEDVPVSALERTLFLEADRMGFLAGHISKEMLERERGVVQNEKRQGENAPYGQVFTRMVETIYPYSHPYSWSTIGSMDDLNAATLDDVKEWYRTYYGPNNAVLVLAGDITAERALELTKKYFDKIPPGPPLPRTEEWIPKFERNVRDEMQDRVPQTRIYRVYHAPAWRDAQVQHLGLVGEVLSGSKSSRLDKALVYDKELLTEVSAGVWEKELGSSFIITGTVKNGVDPALAEKAIDDIVNDVIKNGVKADELQRAQSRITAGFVRGIERLGGFGGRSDVLAQSMTYGGTPDAYLKSLETSSTATPADVQKAAKTWLDTNHYTMVVRPYPQLAAGKTEVDRKVLPTLGGAPDVKFPAIQRATLSNGLKVMLLERHSAPIVNMTLAIDAGYAADPTAKAGLAGLTVDVLDEGTATRDTFAIVNQLDALGAEISTGNSLDMSFVSLSALPMNLSKSLDIYADVVTSPAFANDMVALSKRQRIARIAQEKANPVLNVQRLVPRLLYGASHAYAKPLTGTGYVETLTPLTRDDLSQWHTSWFVPATATLVVAGDVTMDKLKPELERALGSWKGGSAPKKQLDTLPRTAGKKVYLIDKPDAPQSVIVAAHLSETGGRAEDLAIETVMRNFGGIATSRLNRNLRLDKHWSYGTSGQISEARGQRPFLVVAPVQTDKTKEAILEVVKEIKGVAGDRPLTGEEFQSVMRNQTMRLPGAFETLGSLQNAAIRLTNLGYPDDYFANYAAAVRALNETTLNSAAKSYVRPDELVWMVIGDLKKVEAGVRELNLGEVVRLDADGNPIGQ
ncbi:MAG TPA: pitrilysin family protein, partial [Thermoanaerobaculia bacterium]|nr:pitrilysin family protein [Thermoanaerobaculia bacterium]